MDTFEKIMIILVVGTFVFIPIYGYVCHLISKKKMESGVDKRKLQRVLCDIVPAGEDYTVAYASWYRIDYPKFGRHYTTNYWYYAIGFNDNRIYIVPLMLEDGEIYYMNYSYVDKSMVAKIECDVAGGKMRLFDRNGQELAHLQVDEKNNSSHGNGNINLYQEAEARAFKDLITKWKAEITLGGSIGNSSVSTNATGNGNVNHTGTVALKNNASNASTEKKIDFLSAYEMERCLLQQTPSYQRGTPVIAATNEKNEIFLIYYMPITFYIVKVTSDKENKLTVVCDYRRKSKVVESFEYKMTDDGISAKLKLMYDTVEFTVGPKLDCRPWGVNAYLNQTPLYNQFAGFLESYREKINTTAMMMKNENGYTDIIQHTKKINDEDKKEIFKLLDAGHKAEAARLIQARSGLGIVDVMKVAENPYMYL